MLRFKRTVKLKGLKPELIMAYLVAMEVCAEDGTDCQINSANDGKHGDGSLHDDGCAFDLDTHDGWGGTRYCKFNAHPLRIASEIRQRLPSDFDIVFEANLNNEHIHIEYDPKDA